MMYQVIQQQSRKYSVQRLCSLAHVPRCGFYRYLELDIPEVEPDPILAPIKQICEQYHGYGYRRVTKALIRGGYPVNHKRVLALMRREKLLCRRKQRFVRTTDSRHSYRIYPNRARTMSLTGPNQLWVADITYVRLPQDFAYLAVILDAFSRRAIGWALSAHIDTALSLTALRMALQCRQIDPSLVHHSDQGVQYASDEYVGLLRSKNIMISMSRRGNPYDNAKAESFMKTLKAEEVYLNDYETFHDARVNIYHFIETVYNHKRLHSALEYLTPVEFEARYFTQNHSTLTHGNNVSI